MTSSSQHTCGGEKHSPCPHKESILPANEKHTNIHQSNRKRALESGFDGRGWLEGAVKAQHTRRSRHSGAGVNWRTKKGQKRRVKKCKGFKKKQQSWRKETKRLEGCRHDKRERCNWSCTGWPGSRGGEKKPSSEKGDILLAPLEQHFWEKSSSSHSWDFRNAQRKTSLPSTHSHHKCFLVFLLQMATHSFMGCVINLRLTRPPTTNAQLVFSWILSSFDERVLHVSMSLRSVRHIDITPLPSHTRV